MKTSRTTVENIRPILQAMERSIESARRRRLNQHEVPVAPAAAPPPPAPVRAPVASEENGDPPRRKARPKRPAMMTNEYRATY